MLDALKKKLMGDKPTESLEEVQEAVVEAISTEATSPDLSAQLADALSVVESLNAVIAEKESLLAELAGKVEQLSQFAEAAEAQAKALREEAEAKAVAAKQEMLADVIGKDNPGFATTFEAIKGLDEAAFSVVVAGFKASFAKEAESVMFKEVGVGGEAEVVEEDATMSILKKQYSK
jgi:hypothetical protein